MFFVFDFAPGNIAIFVFIWKARERENGFCACGNFKIIVYACIRKLNLFTI